MNKALRQTLKFCSTFNLLENPVPTLISQSDFKLRVVLLREEIAELEDAYKAGDMVEIVDALGDIQVVLDYTIIAFGLHRLKRKFMNIIFKSNMSKLDEDGRPIYHTEAHKKGKVKKGPSYQPPTDAIRKLLAKSGWV